MKRRWFLALLAGVLLAGVALACGPFWSEPVFTLASRPDQPMTGYAQGSLGVVLPTYWRAYLALAYRQMSGRPFSAPEQQALAPYFGLRQPQREARPRNWVQTWVEERGKMAGAGEPAVKLSVYDSNGISRSEQRGTEYLGYYNCLAGAFETAVATLRDRAAKFGAGSPHVRSWITAQDQVFSNCESKGEVPAAAEAAAPELIRADRAYQIAAAKFYGGDLDAAARDFEAIAANAQSPWSSVAALLSARAIIRQATLRGGENQFDAALMKQARAKLQAVIADPNRRDVHASAARLLGWVELRADSAARARVLSAALLGRGPQNSLAQDLIDYTFLLDKLVDSGESGYGGLTLFALRRDDELTDWIFTFQSADSESLAHALRRWQQTKGVPWLVAAVSKTAAAQPHAAELVKAAATVPPSSPAFVTVAFHRARLLHESGDAAAARQVLESLPQRLAPSATNLVKALRLKLATSFNDFLAVALRLPAGIALEGESDIRAESPEKPTLLFDADAARAFNGNFPVDLLAMVPQQQGLPAHLRRDVALAAWTRAILLDRQDLVESLAPTVAQLAPELRADVDAYRAAPQPRRFALVWTLLRTPGLRFYVHSGEGRQSPLREIDNFRHNWWCAMRAPQEAQVFNWYLRDTRVSAPLRMLYPEKGTVEPLFPPKDQRERAAAEWVQLQQLAAAPTWLARETLDYAKGNPDDPRVPEALHLVVRASRYGCNDTATGEYSKAAHTLLHSRYRSSAWAKKTPYWYK